MASFTDPLAFFQTEGTYTPDRLVLGGKPVAQKVTILTGQNLLRGAVLGKITVTGEYILSLSAAVDGSQTPDAILAQPINATAADKEALAYFTGEFNDAAIILGTAHTVATVWEGLRAKGIILIPVVAA